MEDNRKDFIAWIEANKVPLAVAGFSVAIIVLLALRFGKSEDIMKLWDYLEKGIKHSSRSMAPIVNAEKAVMAISKEQVECAHTSPHVAYEVGQHIRNLPSWQHHSAEKAIEAASKGIELLSSQTLVDAYMRGAA